MDFFIKALYSLLFGVIAYLLFLILSKAATNWRSLAIICLLCLASTLIIDKFSNASAFVPSKEIYLLIKFDFMLVGLYVLSRFQHTNFKNNASKSLQATGSFRAMESAYNFLSKYAVFAMLYIYQLVSIWLLTKRYLIEARWH